MNWKFWNRTKSLEADKLEHISKCLEQLVSEKNQNNDTLIEEKLAESIEQVNRLSRLQYKTGQDIMNKVTPIYENLGNLTTLCQKGMETLEIKSLENRNLILVGSLLQTIDSIDGVLTNDHQKMSEEWRNFLMTLQETALEGLEKIGIVEVEVKGVTFNPTFAESVGVKTLDQLEDQNRNYHPYEVIEVLYRGFINGEGQVIRKAQVISIKQ